MLTLKAAFTEALRNKEKCGSLQDWGRAREIMHVKEFCAFGKLIQMRYVFLNCRPWLGQPPGSGQNVFVDANAAFPGTFPRDWAMFPCDFKKRYDAYLLI